MGSPTYDDIIAANLRAARARAHLAGSMVVERMRTLGFATWHRQTLGKVERGERRLVAAEIIGLAYSLETAISVLLCPVTEEWIAFPSGDDIAAESVISSVRGRNDKAIRWNGAALLDHLGT